MDEPGRKGERDLRLAAVVTMGAAFAIALACSLLLARYEQVFNAMDMKELPLLNEGALALGRAMRSWGWLVGLLLVPAGILVWKGWCDRALWLVVGLNVFVMLVFALGTWSTWRAIAGVAKALEGR